MRQKEGDLQKRVGERVSIKGVAHNAKAGAVVLLDSEQVVYIKGMKEWPEVRIGKSVVIAGILRREHVYPDVTTENGAPSQGLPGEQFTLEVDDRHSAG